MLSGILKKEDCASCRFCCSFRRTSLWETPIFTKENIEAIKEDRLMDENALIVSEKDGYKKGTYDLSHDYKTDDPDEEVPCPYLGENGCVLNEKEKPWDCSIWPLRVMRKENENVIALTPTCPSINRLDIGNVKEYVDENLRKDIMEYADKHPFLIKEYRPDFPIL